MFLALAASLAVAAPADVVPVEVTPAAAAPAEVVTDAPARAGQTWWVGLTPPTFGWSNGLAVGMDVNLRLPSPVSWVQPEVAVAATNGIGAYYVIPYPSDNWSVRGTAGARFGRDHGFYGGLGLGAGVGEFGYCDAKRRAAIPAARLYGGYAFRAGDHMRISPEIEIAHLITVAMRFEWGG
ncbi:MAG: hypothetical protein ACK4YP_04545 [Myxococcota bacterium]